MPEIDPYYVQEDDHLEEMQERLTQALGFADDAFERLSPEARNLFSARRRLGHRWLDDYEIVVEIAGVSPACHCGVKEGQQLVFSMRHVVQPQKSTAPLCLHLMSPVLSLFYMTFDRAAEGLNPMTCVWRFAECPLNETPDRGAKTWARMSLRRIDTGEIVTARILPPAGETA